MGQVYLVAGGPGDPDLLTVKADALLRRATAVAFDASTPAAVLALVPDAAQRLDLSAMAEADGMEALSDLAARTERLVVVKGGDAIVQGRAAAEIEFLSRRAIGFEIVPGISTAAGLGARRGLPLTHRGAATGVRFVVLGDVALGEPNWTSLADSRTTLAFEGDLSDLERLFDRLSRAGLAVDTPVAVFSDAFAPPLRTTLEGLRGYDGTAMLVVVGQAVEVAEHLEPWVTP